METPLNIQHHLTQMRNKLDELKENSHRASDWLREMARLVEVLGDDVYTLERHLPNAEFSDMRELLENVEQGTRLLENLDDGIDDADNELADATDELEAKNENEEEDGKNTRKL